MRVGMSFQASLSIGQQQTIGLPDLNGKLIAEIAGEINSKSMPPDQIPISIFFAGGRWITINNRGYTAYALANVRPLRLFPSKPSQDELNRLRDEEGKGEIKDFKRNGHKLAKPRKLPSSQMPVTAGPNSWDVQYVVNLPQAWDNNLYTVPDDKDDEKEGK